MFYIGGKISQYGIRVNIVYNELGHKNMTNFEYLFFLLAEFRNKYQYINIHLCFKKIDIFF